MDLPPLATCRFQEFREEMGVPVRTTVGKPRFQLPYQLRHNAGEIAPDYWMLKITDRDRYQLAYTQKLDKAGVEKVAGILRGILLTERAEPGVPAVLLCFDDLTKPDGWCHRTMFATWWTFHTGQPVPELAGQPQRGTFRQEDPTLF